MHSCYSTDKTRRIAVVHEWLTDWGGSESVTAAMLDVWPDAQLHALFDFLSPEDRSRLGDRPIATTFLQSLPGMHKRFWYWLWLMPYAAETIDLRGYDLVISSSHAFSKGALTSAEQFHVSYVHSPMRYAWDMYHDYLLDYRLDSGLKGAIARAMFHRLRLWDRQTANNVDLFLANSGYVARRVWRAYRRPAIVLHPPVNVEDIPYGDDKDDFYLTVSRLVSYKRIDLVVQSFAQMPRRRLVVIGEGPEFARIRSFATPNITMLGYQPDAVVRDYMSRARAFVFAAKEDFGISPVEAQAAGTPVIAFGHGGALETVRGLGGAAEPTGVFFTEQTIPSLEEAITRFEGAQADVRAPACRANAMFFSKQRFVQQLKVLVDTGYGAWQRGEDPDLAALHHG